MKKSILLFLAGLIILTYGVTRCIVTIEVLGKCNNFFVQYNPKLYHELLQTGIPEIHIHEIQKGVSKIQVEIALSQGIYKFRDGLIALAAIAAVFFACSYYFFRQFKDTQKKEGHGNET